MEKNNTSELPDYFVTSENIHWKDRVDIQAIAQESTDTAISSTVNLPVGTKLEDVEQLYLYAWKKGLKGITIFYSGGNRAGILATVSKNQNQSEEPDTIKDIEEKILELEVQKSELTSRKYQSNPSVCPVCGGMIKHVGGCEECIECSWSPCSI
jgi:ribonucleoside-diphosphate reductase alpha chain